MSLSWIEYLIISRVNLFLGKYCDVPLGLYIVRGDNIVLCGNIDESNEESNSNPNFQKISPEQLSALSETIQVEQNQASDGKLTWDFE